jgi:hypothetical protein
MNPDSVVGIATEGLEFESRRVKNFLLVVEIASRVHTTSFPMDTVGSLHGDKAAGA